MSPVAYHLLDIIPGLAERYLLDKFRHVRIAELFHPAVNPRGSCIIGCKSVFRLPVCLKKRSQVLSSEDQIGFGTVKLAGTVAPDLLLPCQFSPGGRENLH